MPKYQEKKFDRTIDPSILQVIMQDEMCGRLEEVTEKLDQIVAFNAFKGPMTRLFNRGLQYQFATILAGGNGQVYLIENPQPDLLMGIVTEVGNNWFPNTYLEWRTDYIPKTVNYVVGLVQNPKEFDRGIAFEKRVEWVAYNNDIVSHVFEVLCDGFWIPKTLFNKIVVNKVPITD